MTDLKTISTRKVSRMRLAIWLLACLYLPTLAATITAGIRAHSRELALQIEVNKLKSRRQLREQVDYQSVEVDGCEYLIFETGVTHAATCVNPIHKGNQ